MPTYVYKFVDTGETIEVQQAFTDDALTEAAHPASGIVMRVKKVFQPVGVTFKGGGFYKTDSRGGSSKAASTTDTPASTTPSTDGGSTTPAPATPAPATPAPAPAKTPAASPAAS